MVNARSLAQALATCLFCSGLIGCHPGPVFVRRSGAAPDLDSDRSILHQSYVYEDPWGLFPPTFRWTVRRVDGQTYSYQGRILLDPGVHWVLLEGDLPFGSTQWHSFEFDTAAGYQYELRSAPGCLFSIWDNVVRRWHVDLTLTAPDGRQDHKTVLALCCYADEDPGCQSDRDCREGLECITEGQTGFGLCAHSSD